MATQQTITAILKKFLNAYPLQSHENTDAIREIWFDVLADVPDDALLVVASEYLKSSAEWRPVPGKLRARALELGRATPTLQAEDAWNRCADIDDDAMIELARQHGDAVAEQAIRAMRAKMRGLNRDADAFEIMAERQRAFLAAYVEIAGRAVLVGLPAGVKHEYARIGG